MKIYCSKGANIYDRYLLGEGLINIGRSKKNDIVLDDPTCSRQHAVILVEDGLAFLANLKPANPIFINGREVKSKTPIRPGDIVEMGETELHILEDNEEPEHIDRKAYKSQDTVNIDVRAALREFMEKDIEKVSTEATTRIKQQNIADYLDILNEDD
jgi:pSer/pThr/pTyr-binding forkhead associated (FHA) protein